MEIFRVTEQTNLIIAEKLLARHKEVQKQRKGNESLALPCVSQSREIFTRQNDNLECIPAPEPGQSDPAT